MAKKKDTHNDLVRVGVWASLAIIIIVFVVLYLTRSGF